MKSSAIDCTLNALEHGSKSCFLIRSGGPLFLYNPDYKEDLKEAQSQYRVRDEEAAPAAVEELEAPPAPAEAASVSVEPNLAAARAALTTNAGRLNAGAGPQVNRNSPNLAVENDK